MSADPTLIEWFRARLDEDQPAAEVAAISYGPGWGTRVLADIQAKRRIIEAHDRDVHYCPIPIIQSKIGQLWDRSDKDPAPACWTILLLAQPYADAPGFRDEWKLES